MFNPLVLHTLAHRLSLRGIRKIPVVIARLNYFLTGCDISPLAQVGKNVRFQHFGAGVIVHANVQIGDDVWIMPQVVLGQNIRDGVPLPVSEMSIKIGKGVMLGAGAKIIASGHIEIGEGAAIGANAVVLQSVPPRCLAVGIPARIKVKS